MYKRADKAIGYLNKRFVKIYSKAKYLSSYDEVHIMGFSRKMFNELDEITREAFLRLAKSVYSDYTDSKKTDIDMGWLIIFLEEYNPVIKFVYIHEVDRKMVRFAESLIASTTKLKEITVSLRYWSNMVSQYAIDVTDAALIQAFKDEGVKKVEWITEEDDRVCGICDSRHLKVYKIDKVPPKPHYGCRCYIRPVSKQPSYLNICREASKKTQSQDKTQKQKPQQNELL